MPLLPTPERILFLIEEHKKCLDFQYFIATYSNHGKIMAQRTWLKIKEVHQMDRVLRKLKSQNKTL